MIRIALVEDNLRSAEEISALLQPEYKLIAIFVDGISAIKDGPTLAPDILLLDLSLGDVTGFDVARSFVKMSPKTRIIFLTALEHPDLIREAREIGAYGYVLKSRAAAELVLTVQKVSQGVSCMPLAPGRD